MLWRVQRTDDLLTFLSHKHDITMPMKKGYGRRRGKKVAGRRRKVYRRAYRAPRGVPEWASCTESVDLTNITGAVYSMNGPGGGAVYGLNGTQLAQFIQRAVPIAKAYQHYRIKRIQLEFKPQVDTFFPDVGAGGNGFLVPQFYYMINKSGSIPANVTAANMRAMGARPIRFDEKTIKVAWRPSVLQENAGVLGDIGSGYKISPWLSTNANANAPGAWNPSTVQHLGIYWQVERPGTLPAGVAELTYAIQITVEFQFKKPLVTVSSSVPPALEYVTTAQ